MAIQRSAFFFGVVVDFLNVSETRKRKRGKKKRRKKRARVPSWEDCSMGCHRLQSLLAKGGRGERWRR